MSKQYKIVEKSKYQGDNVHGVYESREEAENDLAHFEDRYCIECEIEEEESPMAHIHLYGDELKYNLWRDYCRIVGVKPSETDKITINFDKRLVRINKTNEELNEKD